VCLFAVLYALLKRERLHNFLRFILMLFLVGTLAACGTRPTSGQFSQPLYKASTAQQVQYGTVAGLKDESTGTLSWLGVPYAKPPVAELRWKAPQDPDPWSGVLETKAFASSSLQSKRGVVSGSEDCLYLNIWRPNTDEENLPVLVFAHGGGNRTRSGESFVGDILAAKTNSIVISINYRLGPMGWFRHPALRTGDPKDDSGNFGLLDIFKSLTWVQENIKSFGGSPDKVTLAGLSAGGRDALVALISPLAEGLFHQVAAFSAGMTLAETESGDQASEQVLAKLVISQGHATNEAEAVEWLAEKSNQELAGYLKSVDAEAFLPLYADSAIKMKPFPHLFKDGHVIPKEGFELLRRGDYHKVPVLLGSTATEFSVFAVFDPYFMPAIMDQSIFSKPELLDTYQKTVHYGSQIYSGFNVENVAEALTANPSQPPVYGYRFGWGTLDGVTALPPKILFGSPHGGEMDFLTGHETSEINAFFVGSYYTDQNKPGRDALSHLLMSYIGNFLHTADPNGPGLSTWEAWSGECERILKLNASKDAIVVAMSEESFEKNEVVKEMKETLTDEQFNLIVDQLLDGRFFWDQWKD
jgi:para-nitrobenzyl esterase